MIGTIATIELADEQATAALAEDVAVCLVPGDAIALSGGLGVGKTTFARALIRAFVDDWGMEVPSPTFTLAQTYSGGRWPLAHFDLYRIAGPDEMEEIGLAEALSDGAILVEWPDRAEAMLPDDRLGIEFAIVGEGRRAIVTGGLAWQSRFGRTVAARSLLDRSGWTGARRRHLRGDASTRRYERIAQAERRAVLMDWPPVGAALPAGDSRARFRARDVRAFVAVDNALRTEGFSAPEIYASDLAEGFLLLEDLGTEGIVAGNSPIPERFSVAVEVLAAIHSQARPTELPLPDGSGHRLMRLAADVLTAETGLFADSFVPHITGAPLSGTARAAFDAIWAELFARVADVERSWVLFDVQSPNLFWLGAREGLARIGLIDFQDMFHGPSAYDVASLCQDARVTVPAALQTALRDRYVALRRAADADFDGEAFAMAYAILGTLRIFKNLGVFARFADHAGRPHYLDHIPRLREYLGRNFTHPVLSALALWYEGNLSPGDRPPR
jgi:tRNA threonylcarbamoyl adenosine modification protein YjeE